MRIAVLSACALYLFGCGIFSGGGIPVPAEEKDFVTDAQAALTKLKSEYVLLKGMSALVTQKVDEFLYIEDGLKLGRVKWGKFQAELKLCWSTPMEAVKNAEQRSVNALEAAKHLKNRTTLQELQVVRDTGFNAVKQVKACPQTLADRVRGMPKRSSDEAKEWAHGKFQLLNDLRVLVKRDVPARVKKLGGTATSSATTIAKQLTQAKAYSATLQKLGAKGVLAKNNAQVQKLQNIQKRAMNLQKQVTTDAGQVGASVSDAAAKIATGIDSFKN